MPKHDQMLVIYVDFTWLELVALIVGEIKDTQHFHLIRGISLSDHDTLLIHRIDVRAICLRRHRIHPHLALVRSYRSTRVPLIWPPNLGLHYQHCTVGGEAAVEDSDLASLGQ